QRPAAAEKDVRLELEAPDGLPAVSADRDRLAQVLTNLVDNAIKFTPRGGVVRVRVRHVAGAIGFSVRDTGPGIAADDIDHLFAPFWQAKRKGAAGAGLGLSIAAGIVAAHRGRIAVRSRPGEGSTFYFAIGSGSVRGVESGNPS